MQILTEAFLQALNMSFTAGIVILCVCLARLLLRRAPAVLRYALWAVVLFRLLCPVSFESALALLPTDPAPVGTEILYAAQPEVHTGIAPVDEAVRESLPAAEPAHSVNPLQIASAVGAAVWAAGGAGMLLAGVLSLLRLRRRLRGARGAEAGVWVAAGLPTAFVLGVVRPRIYLPEGLNDRERGLILAHERAHIRRGDPALRLLAWTALCLHWFNPLVWLAFALSGRDMEAACDEAVLRRLGPAVKRDYSAALLRVATGRRISLAAPLAFGEGGGVKGRIRGVLRWKKPALWITAALAALVVALGVGLALNRPQPASYLRAGGALYRKEAATVERLPEGSEAASLVSSVLHSTDEIPAQEGQATNLDEKYAGCAIYRAGDRAYVEDYGGFYLVFAREAEDLGGAAEEIQRALGVEGAQLLLVRQEDAGRLAVFAAGEEVGACLLPSGEDADFAPRPGAGEAAALRLAAFDVLVCGDGGLVRAEREDASGLARVEGSAGAEGPTVFVFPGAADGEAVYRFYDEAGERQELRLTVQASLVRAAAVRENGAERELTLSSDAQEFLARVYGNALLRSAAWEGLPEAQIGDGLRLALADGETAYIYLYNGATPVLQCGSPGLYTLMDAADYALCEALMRGEADPRVFAGERLYHGQAEERLGLLPDDAAALAETIAEASAQAQEPGRDVADVPTAYRLQGCRFSGAEEALYVYAEGSAYFAQRGESGPRAALSAETGEALAAAFPLDAGLEADVDGDGRLDRVRWDLSSRGGTLMAVFVELADGRLLRGDIEGLSPAQLEAADVTGDGRDEVIALCDLGGVGGAGSFDLAVWTLANGALERLPLPAQDPEEAALGWNSGYAFEPRYADGFRVRVTGERLDVTYEIPEEMRGAYVGNGFGADGNALLSQSGSADGVSAIEVAPGTGGAAEVRLWQYLWVYGHSDCVGYAVSTLAWDGAAFQLLQQEVVPSFPG